MGLKDGDKAGLRLKGKHTLTSTPERPEKQDLSPVLSQREECSN